MLSHRSTGGRPTSVDQRIEADFAPAWTFTQPGVIIPNVMIAESATVRSPVGLNSRVFLAAFNWLHVIRTSGTALRGALAPFDVVKGRAR